MQIDFSEIAYNLYKKEDIWFSNTATTISYPDDGNDIYFEIEDNSFWFKHRNNCILKAIENSKPEGIFLEVGGGNGYVSAMLQSNEYTVALLEPGMSGCVNAKKRNVENVICASFQDVEFQANKIGAIGVFDVLEHIENDKDFLQLINNQLIFDGKLYITVPANKWLWSNEDKHVGHFRRYNLKSLTTLVNKAGFKVEYGTYFFSLLPIPILLLRTIPDIFTKSYNVNNSTSQHNQKKGAISRLLDKVWNKELSVIESKRKIFFGGSCLIVATKR